MKIVGLSEFVDLPEGTIYSHYHPHYCLGLFRKGETIKNFNDPPLDFFYSSLIADFEGEERRPAVDNSQSRWGAFDSSAEFVIYEADDVACVLSMLINTPHETTH